jgi:hypothetical protein
LVTLNGSPRTPRLCSASSRGQAVTTGVAGSGAKEDVHDEQASLSPREAPMEMQGTGRRTDLLLSSLREDTRQTSTADAWRRGPVVAWNWLTALSPFCAECRLEA